MCLRDNSWVSQRSTKLWASAVPKPWCASAKVRCKASADKPSMFWFLLLFFVSNRADSLGGANNDMNIYCSIIEADGRVSAPSKIDVNTSEDDVTPFFNKATKILYFSSKGYQGFGGYDIYQAEQMGSSFADPIPLEKPINSSYDDYYFSADEKLETIYLSTHRL